MNCTTCGNALGADGYCSKCRPASANGTQFGDIEPSTPGKHSDKMPLAAQILVAIAVMISAYIAYRGFSASSSPGAEGYSSGHAMGVFIGLQFWPAVIAYAIAGRRKSRNWMTFAIIYLVVMFLTGWINLSSIEAKRNNNSNTAGDAAQPAGSSVSALSSPEAYSEQLARTIKARQDAYMKRIAECTPKMATVMSVPSFANKATMIENKNNLVACTKIDFDYYTQLKDLYRAVPLDVEGAGWSQSKKKQFLDGFQNASEATMQQVANAEKLEHLWFDSTNDLYQYAIEHAQDFHIENDKITITTPAVQKEFKRMALRSDQLQSDFQKVRSEIRQAGDAAK